MQRQNWVHLIMQQCEEKTKPWLLIYQSLNILKGFEKLELADCGSPSDHKVPRRRCRCTHGEKPQEPCRDNVTKQYQYIRCRSHLEHVPSLSLQKPLNVAYRKRMSARSISKPSAAHRIRRLPNHGREQPKWYQ